VKDGETGLLVDDRGDAFVNAIRKLRDNPPLWQKLSDGARHRIEAGYSHEDAATAWSDTLKEVSRGRHRSSVTAPRRLKLPPLAFEGSTRQPRTQPLVSLYRLARMGLGSFKNRLLADNYGGK